MQSPYYNRPVAEVVVVVAVEVVDVVDVAEVVDAVAVSAVAKKADYKSGFDGQIFVNYSDPQQQPRATANVKHLWASAPLPSLSKVLCMTYNSTARLAAFTKSFSFTAPQSDPTSPHLARPLPPAHYTRYTHIYYFRPAHRFSAKRIDS